MDETVRFEDKMGALDAVVKQLENGEGSLDDMIGLYEKGMALVKDCNALLDAYEARITKLSGGGEDTVADA